MNKNEEESLQLKYNKSKFEKNRKIEITRIMSEIQEENIKNYIIDCREKNKVKGIKSIVFNVGKINSKFTENKIKNKLMLYYI